MFKVINKDTTTESLTRPLLSDFSEKFGKTSQKSFLFDCFCNMPNKSQVDNNTKKRIQANDTNDTFLVFYYNLFCLISLY